MDIEPGEVDDADDVADLWVAHATEQRRYGSHVDPEGNRSSIREAATSHAATDRLFVARDGDREDGIAGFVMFDVQSGRYGTDAVRGVLENLYVEPASRNRGVGGDLLAAAEHALAERGVETIVLEALADNEAARRFYRRHGYDVHRVTMEKSVD